jgi:hypothetical protein
VDVKPPSPNIKTQHTEATSQSHHLGAVVAGQDAGSRFQLTIGVNDVDAACEDLAGRGVELLNGPIDRPWRKRAARRSFVRWD